MLCGFRSSKTRPEEAYTDSYHRCAAGSCLNSRTDHGLPNNAAEFFGSRAKLLLEIEMDSPSVATVQALVIMSATEAAFTRDARGWLYSGMIFHYGFKCLSLSIFRDGCAT